MPLTLDARTSATTFASAGASHQLLGNAIGDHNNIADNNADAAFSNNLTATITSIRSNVTRVLYMYFQNVTDEHGYGAATTPTTTTTTSNSSSINIATTTERLSNLDASATDALIGAAVDATDQRAGSTLLGTAKTLLQAPLNASSTTTGFLTSASANVTRAASTLVNATAYISSSAAAYATELLNATSTTTTTTTSAASGIASASTSAVNGSSVLTTAPSIIYPPYQVAIRSFENCSALFANYTRPQNGK
ncbi:cell wall integrity sensor MID2-like [Rhagoletis pomonella]|uniref:cell wall integrity sensor MID2-like n=1 Tax=Rhagoletis pomonella TaxID=28610 RepID=UPI00177BEA3A|nr:cell wall integrity sensor MID2-like [Rhagoletis pomonella]